MSNATPSIRPILLQALAILIALGMTGCDASEVGDTDSPGIDPPQQEEFDSSCIDNTYSNAPQTYMPGVSLDLDPDCSFVRDRVTTDPETGDTTEVLTLQGTYERRDYMYRFVEEEGHVFWGIQQSTFIQLYYGSLEDHLPTPRIEKLDESGYVEPYDIELLPIDIHVDPSVVGTYDLTTIQGDSLPHTYQYCCIAGSTEPTEFTLLEGTLTLRDDGTHVLRFDWGGTPYFEGHSGTYAVLGDWLLLGSGLDFGVIGDSSIVIDNPGLEPNVFDLH